MNQAELRAAASCSQVFVAAGFWHRALESFSLPMSTGYL